eukprot:Gb_39205 [translate_table: standard]
MVARTETLDVATKVEARRLWNALLKDGHNLLPKVMPHHITSVSMQGNGGVGTVRQVNFTPDNKIFSYSKEVVDAIDDEKLQMKYSAVDGGFLDGNITSAKFEFKIVPAKDGGSLSTWTGHFDVLSDSANDASNAKFQQMKEDTIGMFKMVEQYLLSNPTLYS